MADPVDNEKLAPVAFFQPAGSGYPMCPRCHKKPLAIDGRGENRGDKAQSQFEFLTLFCGCGFSATCRDTSSTEISGPLAQSLIVKFIMAERQSIAP